MDTSATEAFLFEEKDRIYRMFSDIADSLSTAFFSDPGGARESKVSEAAGGDVLQHVLDRTRRVLQAEKCALFLADLPGRSLILERVSGEVDFAKLKDIATYDLRETGRGAGVTPWVYHRRQPFNARNFDELRHNSEGRWKGNWDRPLYGGGDQARAQFKCVYMAPLMAGKKAIGVIKYENRTDTQPFFDKADERLIDMVAALVTNLVISQRVERNRYDYILPPISTALVSHFDRPATYEPLLETCRRILSADVCSLFLVDDQQNLTLEHIAGLDEQKKEQLRGFGYQDYRQAEGLTPWILRKKSPFNVRSYPDLKGRSEGHHMGRWDEIIYDGRPAELFKSLYSVPLIIGDEYIGVFKVENKNVPPYYFTESDERLFDLIGRLIAVGVRYAKTREHEQYLLQTARNDALGFLAFGISHEFNKALQRMLDRAQNAAELCSQAPVKQKLDQIIHDIEEASKVIGIFRSMRSPAGIADVEIDEVIQKIVGVSRERFTANHVSISHNNLGVKTLHIDPGELQLILINLINNAFESVMKIEGRNRVVEIDVRPKHDEQVVIDVKDSGAGIADEERNLIGAPFFTTKPHGMGIGVYLVQRLVRGMGGRLTWTSPNELEGATFSVTLPKVVPMVKEHE